MPLLQRRIQQGQYNTLLNELEVEDPAKYKNFLRFEPAMFHEILEKIQQKIEKKDTFFRKALEPGLKLAITSRYLVTGCSYRTSLYGLRVASCTISLLVPEVCETVIQAYAEEVPMCPSSPEDWKKTNWKRNGTFLMPLEQLMASILQSNVQQMQCQFTATTRDFIL